MAEALIGSVYRISSALLLPNIASHINVSRGVRCFSSLLSTLPPLDSPPPRFPPLPPTSPNLIPLAHMGGGGRHTLAKRQLPFPLHTKLCSLCCVCEWRRRGRRKSVFIPRGESISAQSWPRSPPPLSLSGNKECDN